MNDDPGVMQPGHCFTIEVGSSFFGSLAWELTGCCISRVSYRVRILGLGFSLMAGQHQQKYVLPDVLKKFA